MVAQDQIVDVGESEALLDDQKHLPLLLSSDVASGCGHVSNK